VPDDPADPFDPPGRPKIHTRPTVRIDPSELKPSWPIAIATLERLGDWTILAMRLGVLSLINNCVRELCEPNASADHIARLRELVEVLAHLPFDR
jgi:hypothetical protein